MYVSRVHKGGPATWLGDSAPVDFAAPPCTSPCGGCPLCIPWDDGHRPHDLRVGKRFSSVAVVTSWLNSCTGLPTGLPALQLDWQ